MPKRPAQSITAPSPLPVAELSDAELKLVAGGGGALGGVIGSSPAPAPLGSKGGICEQTFGEAGVSTPQEARDRVRKLIADGADFIKICTGGGVIGTRNDSDSVEMPQEVVDAIVAEAHKRGKKVAAHAQGPNAIRAAANAGVDSIEHGGFIDEDAARLLAQKHIVLVPTLARIMRDTPRRLVAMDEAS